MNDAAAKRVESRDAVLWTILSDSSCQVKIQGSNELITCHFPRNQKARPSWLRVGNAVRISHRGGVRGYIEVSGQGRAIPQPVLGSALPTQGTTGDGIVSGMIVSQSVPASLIVQIASGSFRINETIYNYAGGNSGTLNAAPSAGYFRYDLLVIGANGVIDYIVGTPATSNPQMPATPADHVLLNFILRVAGDTAIPAERIGIVWTVPRATSVTLTYTTPFPWDELNDYPETTITATVYDQYGRTIGAPTGGWHVTFNKIVGTGQVYSSTSGYDDTEVEATISSGSSTTFKYQRNQTVTELQPYMMVTVESVPPLYAFVLDMVLGALA